jgi:nephrocystin-3
MLTQGEITNRRIRVFVSSTFRDMMEERNLLMTHAWPELRSFCRERQVELVEVDLRWGIAEEQSTRKETLKLCMDEIRACRPYFIGLLGERYGWVPGDDAFTADLKEEQPWLKDLHGKSVTELEILHGVLNNPEMTGRAFFYFRDPKYVDLIPEDKKADFLSENHASAEKQTALKTLIHDTCKSNKISLFETYPNPQSLAPIILKHLKDAISKQFPEEDIPDPLTREARDHEAFAEIRRRTYVGRPDYFKALDNHCKSNGKPLLLLGDSGSGKSALIANWVEHWRKDHSDDFIFQHYIGGTTDSSIHWKLMIRLIAEIKRWSGDTTELPHSNDDILRDFPVWLVKARIKAQHDGVRFIVILDAINQLEDKDHGHALGWLPFEPFTENLRLIVSTLPGGTLEALEKRALQVLKIAPMTPEEDGRMIVDYLKRFGKSLDKQRIERISNNKAAANPLYLKILLDELRVTGTYEKLDERLDDYLESEDIPSLLRKVLDRYQHDYEHDRKGLVSEALGLIWSARRGLTEAELVQLLRPDNLPQLPLAIWSPFRAVLEESLIDRGGVLNFVHDFLRMAIENAFLSDLDKQDDYRIMLTDYFEAKPPTARSSDELPWLLMQTEQFGRLRKYLLNIDNFLLIFERNRDELRQYWVDLGDAKQIGKPYLDSFTSWTENPELMESRISFAANELAYYLSHEFSIYKEAQPLMEKALQIDEKIYGPDHPNVAIRLNNLAQLLQAKNRLKEAELLMKRALSIDEKYYGHDHPEIAISLNNLALLLQATNRLKEAIPLMERAVIINETIYGKDHPNFAYMLGNLALLLEEANFFNEAESLKEQALQIDEKSYGPDHPAVARDLNNLALLLQATNRLKEAIPLMERALNIDKKNYGPDDPNVATMLMNLAQLFQAANRFEVAEPLIKRALEIEEMVYGPDHPKVAISLNNLARLLQDTNRLDQAETLFERALKINEKSYGPDHPDVATILGNLGQLLQDTNRRKEAESFLLRALKIDEKNYGPDHTTVARRLNNLAMLLQDTNKLKEAELLMKRALEIFEKNLGEDHSDVATILNNIALLLKATNRLAEAEPLFKRALKITEKSYGPDHPAVANRLCNLAMLLNATHRLEEAEPIMKRALMIDEKSYGLDHPTVAKDLVNLATLLQDKNRFKEAELLYERALRINEKSYGTDHPMVANSINNLAGLLIRTNRMKEAEPLVKKALESLIIYSQLNDCQHPYLQTVIDNYVGLLLALGWNKEHVREQLGKMGLNI